METIQVTQITLQVPKELNDVRVAILGVITDIKAGKNIIESGLENLQALQAAVVGIGNIPAEFTNDKAEAIVLGALLGGEIIATLVK